MWWEGDMALVIGSENEVRVLLHVHGQKVQDEVEADDLGEASADEFAGG